MLGNPHSINPTSAASTEVVERARAHVPDYFNASPEEYVAIFTANATGALRLVGEASAPGDRFLLTFDNHNSVNRIREFARTRAAETTYVPSIAPELRVDEELLPRYLTDTPGVHHNLFAYPTHRTSPACNTRCNGSSKRTHTDGTCCSMPPPMYRPTGCRGMFSGFTPSHRGGSGPPLACLHRFMYTWRSWELVLPALKCRHDVLALTLRATPRRGPLIGEDVSSGALVDAVERAIDAAGIEIAHLLGNSLGGYLALQLAARDRTLTVVAFAPAGGWSPGEESYKHLLRPQRDLRAQMKAVAPHAESVVVTPIGRRQATQLTTTTLRASRQT